MKTAAETLTTIAADPRHLGARIGVTSVLHTWGQTLDHHPHVHCIVPGGGIAVDGQRWISCRPGFFLSVRVLSRLFRRLFLEGLADLHANKELQFFGTLRELEDQEAFKSHLASHRKREWVVYAKAPFAGPEQVLAYLARYTHRVAVSNRRLVALKDGQVSFRWKDYRATGRRKTKTMCLPVGEFMRRFLLHVLPDGFHRIRHYGLFANGHRADKIERCRVLLGSSSDPEGDIDPADSEPLATAGSPPCPSCGGRMRIFESFEGLYQRRPPARRPDGL